MLAWFFLRAGDPPLLTYCLQHRLGVRVKRRESRETVVKPTLTVSTNPQWKVGSRPRVKPELLRSLSPLRVVPQVSVSQAEV